MANIKERNYAFSKINLKNGVSQFSNQIQPQVELTLAFNPSVKMPSESTKTLGSKKTPKTTIWVSKYRPLSLDYVTRKYFAFFARMDDELFGRRCHKARFIKLIKHIGVIEHLDTNPHIHASIHIPDMDLIPKFLKLGKKLWETKIQESGEFNANQYRGAVWDNYIVKDIYTTAHTNLVLFGGK
jgi:hypothetical protein